MLILLRFVVCATLLIFAGTAAAAEFPMERPPLPGGSVKGKERHRYSTAATYTDVLEFYKRVFKNIGGVRWYTVINQPGVRAKHLRSLRSRSKWEGVNIAEHGGRTHVYILMREDK
ncbi:MAG: hypothetical protein AAFQ82_04480 [Myxococcota bacterium]